ncbi:hypothetical protein CSIM01_13243, partial [Colletotrichum simmondsii]
RAAGSYTSRSRQTTPSARRRYASRRPWCTPTLRCRRARSASTCSRTPGRRPTASSRACAPCARCSPTRRRTRRSTSTSRRCCAAGTCWARARSSSFGAAMTRGGMMGRRGRAPLGWGRGGEVALLGDGLPQGLTWEKLALPSWLVD